MQIHGKLRSRSKSSDRVAVYFTCSNRSGTSNGGDVNLDKNIGIKSSIDMHRSNNGSRPLVHFTPLRTWKNMKVWPASQLTWRFKEILRGIPFDQFTNSKVQSIYSTFMEQSVV